VPRWSVEIGSPLSPSGLTDQVFAAVRAVVDDAVDKREAEVVLQVPELPLNGGAATVEAAPLVARTGDAQRDARARLGEFSGMSPESNWVLKPACAIAEYQMMRLTTLLKTDVDEIVNPYVRWWVGLSHKHPVAMPVLDLAVYAVPIALAWIFLGPAYGVLALGATVGLYGYAALRVWRRKRRTH
jgi:hypothetical protein